MERPKISEVAPNATKDESGRQMPHGMEAWVDGADHYLVDADTKEVINAVRDADAPRE